MVAYSIDAAAVLAVLQDTEDDLVPLASLASDLQACVDTAASSLASGRVGRALSNYAAETLFHDLGSAVAGSRRAIQSVKAAVAEYAAADQEMRVRAEAAAATVPAAGVPAAAAPGTTGKGKPLPAIRPGVEPEPERGSIVPLPGPPPWKPVWPQKPLPVLPNPLLRLPYRWVRPPGWNRPPWWMGPPRWMRPPWFPGLPRWPHGPGAHTPRWLWELAPAPGCPGPNRWPGQGCLPPPDCYYPLLPPDIMLPKTDLPVGRMLTAHQMTTGHGLPRPQTSAETEASPGSRKWGLT